MRRRRAGLIGAMVVLFVACGSGETRQVSTGPSSDHSGPAEPSLDFIGELRRPALPTRPVSARRALGPSA
ncbi:MAG TPA: hypothetical protein VHG90_11260, partial [Acidimicrobiales bacterium]|nr:hypothetical protein [Acidimicrobiales bacterium]